MSAFYTFFLKKVKVPSVFSATVKSSFAKNHLDGELLHFGARVLYIYHVHHSLPERLYYSISGLSSWWIDESLERFMLLLSQMVELPSHAHQINLKLPVFLHQALSFMSQSFRSLMSPRGPLRHLLCPCWPYARYSHSGQLLVKCARCRNIYRSIESPSELIQMILDAEMNNKISLPVRWVNFLFTPLVYFNLPWTWREKWQCKFFSSCPASLPDLRARAFSTQRDFDLYTNLIYITNCNSADFRFQVLGRFIFHSLLIICPCTVIRYDLHLQFGEIKKQPHPLPNWGSYFHLK